MLPGMPDREEVETVDEALRSSLRKAANEAVRSGIEEAIELLSQAKLVLASVGVQSAKLDYALDDLGWKKDAADHPRKYYKGKFIIAVYTKDDRFVDCFDNVKEMAIKLKVSNRDVGKLVASGQTQNGLRICLIEV